MFTFHQIFSRNLDKEKLFHVLCLIVLLFVVCNCDVFNSNKSCRELTKERYEINGYEFQRYHTKFTIEFTDEWSHDEGGYYLQELGYPFEPIWSRTYVVETGCTTPAEDFYTNYGTDEVISLGDSSFVKYVNPVFYFKIDDSDFRLRGLVGVQFDRDLEFDQIAAVAKSENLKFRDYNPGAPFNRYWLIVPKEACCNPFDMAKKLKEYDEVELAEPDFSFTIPNPSNPNSIKKDE